MRRAPRLQSRSISPLENRRGGGGGGKESRRQRRSRSTEPPFPEIERRASSFQPSVQRKAKQQKRFSFHHTGDVVTKKKTNGFSGAGVGTSGNNQRSTFHQKLCKAREKVRQHFSEDNNKHISCCFDDDDDDSVNSAPGDDNNKRRRSSSSLMMMKRISDSFDHQQHQQQAAAASPSEEFMYEMSSDDESEEDNLSVNSDTTSLSTLRRSKKKDASGRGLSTPIMSQPKAVFNHLSAAAVAAASSSAAAAGGGAAAATTKQQGRQLLLSDDDCQPPPPTPVRASEKTSSSSTAAATTPTTTTSLDDDDRRHPPRNASLTQHQSLLLFSPGGEESEMEDSSASVMTSHGGALLAYAEEQGVGTLLPHGVIPNNNQRQQQQSLLDVRRSENDDSDVDSYDLEDGGGGGKKNADPNLAVWVRSHSGKCRPHLELNLTMHTEQTDDAAVLAEEGPPTELGKNSSDRSNAPLRPPRETGAPPPPFALALNEPKGPSKFDKISKRAKQIRKKVLKHRAKMKERATSFASNNSSSSRKSGTANKMAENMRQAVAELSSDDDDDSDHQTVSSDPLAHRDSKRRLPGPFQPSTDDEDDSEDDDDRSVNSDITSMRSYIPGNLKKNVTADDISITLLEPKRVNSNKGRGAVAALAGFNQKKKASIYGKLGDDSGYFSTGANDSDASPLLAAPTTTTTLLRNVSDMQQPPAAALEKKQQSPPHMSNSGSLFSSGSENDQSSTLDDSSSRLSSYAGTAMAAMAQQQQNGRKEGNLAVWVQSARDGQTTSAKPHLEFNPDALPAIADGLPCCDPKPVRQVADEAQQTKQHAEVIEQEAGGATQTKKGSRTTAIMDEVSRARRLSKRASLNQLMIRPSLGRSCKSNKAAPKSNRRRASSFHPSNKSNAATNVALKAIAKVVGEDKDAATTDDDDEDRDSVVSDPLHARSNARNDDGTDDDERSVNSDITTTMRSARTRDTELSLSPGTFLAASKPGSSRRPSSSRRASISSLRKRASSSRSSSYGMLNNSDHTSTSHQLGFSAGARSKVLAESIGSISYNDGSSSADAAVEAEKQALGADPVVSPELPSTPSSSRGSSLLQSPTRDLLVRTQSCDAIWIEPEEGEDVRPHMQLNLTMHAGCESPKARTKKSNERRHWSPVYRSPVSARALKGSNTSKSPAGRLVTTTNGLFSPAKATKNKEHKKQRSTFRDFISSPFRKSKQLSSLPVSTDRSAIPPVPDALIALEDEDDSSSDDAESVNSAPDERRRRTSLSAALQFDMCEGAPGDDDDERSANSDITNMRSTCNLEPIPPAHPLKNRSDEKPQSPRESPRQNGSVKKKRKLRTKHKKASLYGQLNDSTNMSVLSLGINSTADAKCMVDVGQAKQGSMLADLALGKAGGDACSPVRSSVKAKRSLSHAKKQAEVDDDDVASLVSEFDDDEDDQGGGSVSSLFGASDSDRSSAGPGDTSDSDDGASITSFFGDDDSDPGQVLAVNTNTRCPSGKESLENGPGRGSGLVGRGNPSAAQRVVSKKAQPPKFGSPAESSGRSPSTVDGTEPEKRRESPVHQRPSPSKSRRQKDARKPKSRLSTPPSNGLLHKTSQASWASSRGGDSTDDDEEVGFEMDDGGLLSLEKHFSKRKQESELMLSIGELCVPGSVIAAAASVGPDDVDEDKPVDLDISSISRNADSNVTAVPIRGAVRGASNSNSRSKFLMLDSKAQRKDPRTFSSARLSSNAATFDSCMSVGPSETLLGQSIVPASPWSGDTAVSSKGSVDKFLSLSTNNADHNKTNNDECMSLEDAASALVSFWDDEDTSVIERPDDLTKDSPRPVTQVAPQAATAGQGATPQTPEKKMPDTETTTHPAPPPPAMMRAQSEHFSRSKSFGVDHKKPSNWPKPSFRRSSSSHGASDREMVSATWDAQVTPDIIKEDEEAALGQAEAPNIDGLEELHETSAAAADEDGETVPPAAPSPPARSSSTMMLGAKSFHTPSFRLRKSSSRRQSSDPPPSTPSSSQKQQRRRSSSKRRSLQKAKSVDTMEYKKSDHDSSSAQRRGSKSLMRQSSCRPKQTRKSFKSKQQQSKTTEAS